MMIKAEAVLKIVGGPTDFLFKRKAGPLVGGVDTILCDLHKVGRCCIVYYPANQAFHGVSHGWLDLGHSDIFQRDLYPHSILIVPAHCVKMRRGALHPVDLVHFIGAGGIIDDTPGEMG